MPAVRELLVDRGLVWQLAYWYFFSHDFGGPLGSLYLPELAAALSAPVLADKDGMGVVLPLAPFDSKALQF